MLANKNILTEIKLHMVSYCLWKNFYDELSNMDLHLRRKTFEIIKFLKKIDTIPLHR